MPKKIITYDKYVLKDVSNEPKLWSGKDPVAPSLSDSFRTSSGRKVFSLSSPKGDCAAFICIARLSTIPYRMECLEDYCDPAGSIAVPYSVWSNSPGAGTEIISRVLLAAGEDPDIKRIITLSPKTNMAKTFHLKNGAIELRVNDRFVNFEYKDF